MPGLFAHSNHPLDISEAMHKNAVLAQQLNTYYIDVRYPYGVSLIFRFKRINSLFILRFIFDAFQS